MATPLKRPTSNSQPLTGATPSLRVFRKPRPVVHGKQLPFDVRHPLGLAHALARTPRGEEFQCKLLDAVNADLEAEETEYFRKRPRERRRRWTKGQHLRRKRDHFKKTLETCRWDILHRKDAIENADPRWRNYKEISMRLFRRDTFLPLAREYAQTLRDYYDYEYRGRQRPGKRCSKRSLKRSMHCCRYHYARTDPTVLKIARIGWGLDAFGWRGLELPPPEVIFPAERRKRRRSGSSSASSSAGSKAKIRKREVRLGKRLVNERREANKRYKT